MHPLVGRLASTGLVFCIGLLALWAVLLPSAAQAGAAGATAPHEHLPHTSNAAKDIASFDKTFAAAPPAPGKSTTPINAQRVRLADTLPPSNRLSAPIIVLAVILVLLGFLLHPFRKARRKKHAHQPHDYDLEDDLVDLPTTTDASSAQHPTTTTSSADELVLQTGSNR